MNSPAKTDQGRISNLDSEQLHSLCTRIRRWGEELGFAQLGFTDTEMPGHETHLNSWLENNYHGEMDYMHKHGSRRSRPVELVPGTLSVISARMNYLPPDTMPIEEVLQSQEQAFVSRYALGRDYHKLMRNRLQKLASRIEQEVGEFGYRVFVDSAPVLEKALAEKAGLGWIGKHSNLLNRKAGSWFFLGEIYTNLPLPSDQPARDHCGDCTRCIDICPTRAIIAPYQVDARRCISYLTIELRGSIPEEFRPLLGNRIFGCDDCQLVCPWNRFAQFTDETDFHPRNGLDSAQLVKLFAWEEDEFLKRTEGSAIRRIGHDCWLRNIAIALGNATSSSAVLSSLQSRASHPSDMVREHVSWALAQHIK